VRRGEVWRYEPVVNRPGQPTLRLIVSADVLIANPDLPVILTLHLVDTDPDSLLAVRIGQYGWARALSIEPAQRRRLAERIGGATADEMDDVAAALRAAQDI
jgi:mRNA-degrading endonuclease toxin of MazEF toxin-antitoxin module